MVFNSNNSHRGYAFPRLAGFQVSPQAFHVSCNSPAEIFRCVFLLRKQDMEMHPSTLTRRRSAASCVLRDAGKDTVWHLTLRAFFHTPAQRIISPSSIHFFPHLPACGVFLLSHSCSAGAFNSQACSQIFSNVSCGAKKGFSEFD